RSLRRTISSQTGLPDRLPIVFADHSWPLHLSVPISCSRISSVLLPVLASGQAGLIWLVARANTDPCTPGPRRWIWQQANERQASPRDPDQAGKSIASKALHRSYEERLSAQPGASSKDAGPESSEPAGPTAHRLQERRRQVRICPTMWRRA